MTDRKSIKRALISSVIAILLCCTMLVGTTFAWFTDSVSIERNIIQSGNLDAELEYALWDITTGTWGEYQAVTSTTSVFDENTLWEPGVTEVVKFRVSNVGSLAFKYELGIQVRTEETSTNVYDKEFKLSDYILVGSAAPGQVTDRETAASFAKKNINESTNLAVVEVMGVEIPAWLEGAKTVEGETVAETAEWAFVIHMPESVGNEANHKTGVDAPRIEFSIVLLATQVAWESDDFGTDYDKNATYPVLVENTADLTAAIAAGNDVVLRNDVTLDETLEVGAEDVVIYGNGNKLTAPVGGTRVVNATGIENANVKLVGVDIDANDAERAISFYNNTNVNLELDSCTATANAYALNIASGNKNVNLVISNSDITGYAAVNLWSTTKATFRNCTLTGVNDYAANGSNDFATIVVNEGADNCELVFENCTIVREYTAAGATQYHVIDKGVNTSITWTDCTFKTVCDTTETVNPAAVAWQ